MRRGILDSLMLVLRSSRKQKLPELRDPVSRELGQRSSFRDLMPLLKHMWLVQGLYQSIESTYRKMQVKLPANTLTLYFPRHSLSNLLPFLYNTRTFDTMPSDLPIPSP